MRPGMLARTVVVTLVAVLAATLGDIFLSMAMKSVGEVQVDSLSSLFKTLLRVFSSVKVWLAIALLFTHFLLWLAVLSWADLSLAFPLKASNYVFNAVLAGTLLQEEVSLWRWLGTLVVAFGVLLVSLSAQQPASGPARSSLASAD